MSAIEGSRYQEQREAERALRKAEEAQHPKTATVRVGEGRLVSICRTCGMEHDPRTSHECATIDGVVVRWEADPNHPGTQRLVPATPMTKESALAEILAILQRLDKDDQHRVVDALVALGAG